jgi:hypothetical protein
MKATSNELWALVRVTDASDPIWDSYTTMIGTAEKIRGMFDLSRGVPAGWRLLKGKRARRWLRDSLKEELRYRHDKKARESAGGN